MSEYEGKYFSIMLHIDDDDLGPDEYRLLGHYRRVCGSNGGVCFERTETTAMKTQMHPRRVRAARKTLLERLAISVTEQAGATLQVRVIDRMEENIARFQNSGDTPTNNDRAAKKGSRVPRQEKAGEGFENKLGGPTEIDTPPLSNSAHKEVTPEVKPLNNNPPKQEASGGVVVGGEVLRGLKERGGMGQSAKDAVKGWSDTDAKILFDFFDFHNHNFEDKWGAGWLITRLREGAGSETFRYIDIGNKKEAETAQLRKKRDEEKARATAKQQADDAAVMNARKVNAAAGHSWFSGLSPDDQSRAEGLCRGRTDVFPPLARGRLLPESLVWGETLFKVMAEWNAAGNATGPRSVAVAGGVA